VGNPATYEHCVVKIYLIRLVVFIQHLISILWKTSIQYRSTYKDSDFHGNMKTLEYNDLKDNIVSCNAYCLLYYADLAMYSSSLKKPWDQEKSLQKLRTVVFEALYFMVNPVQC